MWCASVVQRIACDELLCWADYSSPGRSACWMCYRMRVLACEQDFDLAMAYEEHLDRKRQPSLAERPVLPALPLQLGLDARPRSAQISDPAEPTDAGRTRCWCSTDYSAKRAPIRCWSSHFARPALKKKGREHPAWPGSPRTRHSSSLRRPLHQLVDQFVSEHSGIVLHFAAASRDATEPPLPLVWRARLSNHRYLSDVEESHLACSGKGVTRDAAWTSCLGEAAERYSAGCWDAEETVLCRRRDLQGRSLHPADLVLYRQERSADLPYAPYSDETTLRWVRGRSLIHEDDVWVPAIAAFMEYQVHSAQEFLVPITSNGLAAGPTLADAVLSAIYEVLERDAFLIAWLNRLPARRYNAASHPEPDVRQLAESYRRRGVELALFQLPTDHPVAVFASIAFQRNGYGGPYATVRVGSESRSAARGACGGARSRPGPPGLPRALSNA